MASAVSFRLLAIVAMIVAIAFGRPAIAATPDPTVAGPYVAGYGDYKYTAKIDAAVTSAVKVELWARVWYPKASTGKRPLVVMLHGEHGTCRKSDGGNWYIDDNAQYSADGTCPSGYTVTPNHWGYDYIASRLATQGYVVVSINANRGVNQSPEVAAEKDPRNILRRGRLMLRHIQQIGVWATSGGGPTAAIGFNFLNRIDFDKISLFGHSRGGDAIVAAHRLLRESGSPWPAKLPAGTRIRALVAVAPTDVQTDSQAIPSGTTYAVLLPMCDGDVIRLEGLRVYDRTVTQFTTSGFKATFGVWGADHNAYNTEWHTSDSYDFATGGNGTHECPGQTKLFPVRGTSLEQQKTGLVFATAAVRASIENASYVQVLHPDYPLPASFGSARVDRGHKPGISTGSSKLLARFDVAVAGDCAKKIGASANAVSSCGKIPEHSLATTWIARYRWGPPAGTAGTAFHLAVRLNGGTAADISTQKSLELRVAPDCNLIGETSANPYTNYRCSTVSSQGGGAGPQDVYVILQDQSGHYSNYVKLSDYTEQRQAIGITRLPLLQPYGTFRHSILSSARIPLSVFGTQFDRTKVTHAWFSKFGTASGGLFIGDIWSSTVVAPVSPLAAATVTARPGPLPDPNGLVPGRDGFGPPDTIAAASDVVPMAADAGSRVIAVAKAEGTEGAGSVTIEVETRKPMIANSSGFGVRIGGRPVATTHVATIPGRNGAPDRTRFLVPAEAVSEAAVGADLAIVGGGVWNFGPLGRHATP